MDWEKAEGQLKVQVEVGVMVKQQREVEVKAELRVSVQMEHSSWQNFDQGMDYIHTD